MRTFWYAPSLRIKNEPLLKSLIQYRIDEDRWPVVDLHDANLMSSLTEDGKHMPIIDLDFPHKYEESTTPGHGHLYLNVKMSRFKLFVLMWALYFTGVIELGHFVWTIRRGASFVRFPSNQGKTEEDSVKPDYGWILRLKDE